LYFVERIFDYTPIVQGYLRTNQEIRCRVCQTTYTLEQLEALKMYQMQCPRCKSGVCEVTNLSRKYEPLIRAVDAELMLPSTELGILQTLHTEGQGLYAIRIAQELDCSYQLVGKRGKALAERDLVVREKDQTKRRTFSMTDKAARAYFHDRGDAELEVDTSNHEGDE
jgi:DNA-binding MarR family transcriptional regulator